MKGKTKAMLMSLGAMALVAMLGGQAHAVTADTFLFSYDSPNSGDAAELAALETACACDLTLLTKVENNINVQTVGGVNFVDVTPDEPGFFLLKFGNGNNPIDTFVFENGNELNLLAWTNQQLIDNGLAENHVQSISHYAYAGGGGSVPEPASLLLLGAGLAGLGIWRRKQA